VGTPDLFTITIGNLYRGFRYWEHAAFVEDDYRIFPTFSINMGFPVMELVEGESSQNISSRRSTTVS
jgi:hypothetical protein